MSSTALQIVQVQSPMDIEQARGLFLEYAQSLGFSLCFQNFDQELVDLPGDYVPPDGRLFLAALDGKLAGCVALHRLATSLLEERVCEMKRLYVRPEFRGHNVGRNLAERAISEAREMGYSQMRLDTVAGKMDRAILMYRQVGFRQIAPYRQNPMPDALYMELSL